MLEWLFRPRCAACGVLDSPMCAACRASLVELGPACPRCAQPAARDVECMRCTREPLPLDRIIAPWRFGGQLAAAIRRLKFAGATHVARTLAPLWAPLLASVPDAVIVPVPLHWRRRFVRGYDHVWLLALHACKVAGVAPPQPLLRRVRHAPAQSTLPAAERWANVRRAFQLGAHADVAGKTILLVDDVVTTGAT